MQSKKCHIKFFRLEEPLVTGGFTTGVQTRFAGSGDEGGEPAAADQRGESPKRGAASSAVTRSAFQTVSHLGQPPLGL